MEFSIYNNALHRMQTIRIIENKWADIRELRTDDKLEKINKILYIPQENSKTGRSRELVAPIGEQLNSLKKWYKQTFSFECTPDRYVFLD